MASNPTYKPSVYVSRDPTKLAPLSDAKVARRRRTSRASNRAIDGRLSARLDVQAGDGARGDAGARRSRRTTRLPCTPDYTRHRPDLQELGPVRRPAAMDAPDGARRVLRHLLLPSRLRLLRAAAEPRPPAAALGVALRVRRSRPGSTSAARRPASCRRPSGAADLHGGPTRALADRPDLEAGLLGPARDRPGRPHRDAAADGALLRDDRERRPARHAAPRRRTSSSPPTTRRAARSCARFGAAAADADAASTRPRSGSSTRASTRRRTRRSAPRPASSASSRSRSPARPAPPRRSSRCPATRPGKLNQSWWCGYGPSDNPTIVVCAVIENGGHGGTAAAPAALKVFEAVLPQAGPDHDPASTDATDADRSRRHPRPRARGRRARRDGRRSSSFVRRLDWLLLGRGRGARRLRPLGDRRDHAPRPGRQRYLVRQAHLRRRRRVVLCSSALFVDPASTAASSA